MADRQCWEHRVARDNAWPRKQPERKMGAAVALLMAVGRAMTDDGSTAAIDDFLTGPLCLDLGG